MFKRCIRLRESQQSLIRTAKGVLGGKARALGSIHARSGFIRCTLASATHTYLVDVFSIPDKVSGGDPTMEGECPSHVHPALSNIRS